jgi:hypothetical protein
MPIFLDRHDLKGLTAADIAEAHRQDLETQTRYGVRFLTYWFDAARGNGFCLIDAPDSETAMRVHHEAHGNVATDVIEVDLSAVEAFLGRVSDPAPTGAKAEPAFDAALRAIMFTDIVESTAMTARLGDARAVEMVRAHDALVRRALKDKRGREVKHMGDGIMAAFDDATAAVECARAIQQAFEALTSRAARSCGCGSGSMPASRSRTATTSSARRFRWRRACARLPSPRASSSRRPCASS